MKQALQQGFTSRSRWLLQILGLTLDESELRYRMGGIIMPNTRDKRGVGTLQLLVFMVSVAFCGVASAQEKSDTTPCPKPYIKLIKPGLAKAGQQVIVRGRRFGKERD